VARLARVPLPTVTAWQQRHFVPCVSNFLADFCREMSANGFFLRQSGQNPGSNLAEK
jgi:hypothetical protein